MRNRHARHSSAPNPACPWALATSRPRPTTMIRHGTLTLFAALNYLEGKLITPKPPNPTSRAPRARTSCARSRRHEARWPPTKPLSHVNLFARHYTSGRCWIVEGDVDIVFSARLEHLQPESEYLCRRLQVL